MVQFETQSLDIEVPVGGTCDPLLSLPTFDLTGWTVSLVAKEITLTEGAGLTITRGLPSSIQVLMTPTQTAALTRDQHYYLKFTTSSGAEGFPINGTLKRVFP